MYTFGWGVFGWGQGAWGQGTVTSPRILPQILTKYPSPGAVGVAEDEPVRVQFFHDNSILDLTTIQIQINDELAYDGVTGFAPGVIGTVQTQLGVTTVQLWTPEGFPYSDRTTVRAFVGDTAGEVADESWSFAVRDNPACYTGLGVLPVELGVQRPFSTFLAVEPLRGLLFQSVLQPKRTPIANRENKAARAIYQLAYATELSTLQNPFGIYDAAALQTMVCEKQTSLYVDQVFSVQRDRVEDGIRSFQSLGALSEPYMKSFYAYLNSPLYLYRVSLIANMVLFAAAYERRAS